MTLVHSLNELLENTKEPLTKRVKLADNAFKSSQLLLPHKESILLKWILTNSDIHSEETWDTIYKWVNSDQFRELNRNDISNEEISSVIELLTRKLATIENVENKLLEKITNSFLTITENAIFQQYFNYNIEIYCQLVCLVLEKMSSIAKLEEFLKRNLFSKTTISEEKFHKCFLDVILPALIQVLLRFNNQHIFEEASRVVRKCIFYRNHQNFPLFIKQHFEEAKIEKQHVPKILFKRLLHFYEEDAEVAKIKYKLIFNAFCGEFEKDFELVYKFFILLLHIVGFNLEKLILNKTSKLEIPKTKISLRKSQEIVLELLDVFSDKNIERDCKVSELTFTEFIRNLLKQILYFNTPSTTSYKIFNKAMLIDPVAIESITDSVIVYAMTADNKQCTQEYENLIISIFDLYAKLHRMENLVTKIVSTLHEYFGKKDMSLNDVYEFRGEIDLRKAVMEANHFNVDDIFTRNILNHFSTCICSLASWQVINVFKTLLFYLSKSLNEINNVGDDDYTYFTYMEILNSLLGSFLSSIRIAEHTVTGNVVDKSVKELENLRNLLKVFGVAMLNREHNHRLMQSFLSVAYHWAELYIILSYYSNSEVELKKYLDNDFTSCNITYLHHYLNIKQWCLLSERITNFGELPCKNLWKKMYIQKLKAMLLFEESINDDVIVNIVKSISSDLDNNWRYILGDKFMVNNLLAKMSSTVLLSIAESLMNNLDSFDNLHKQFHILDSSLLLTSVNYVGITKINKLITKQKRKLNENTLKISVSSKICSLLTDDILNEGNNVELVEKAKEIYHTRYDDHQFEWKINEEKVNDIFTLLRKFPVIYGSETIQKVFLLYLCSLHDDFRTDFKKGKYESLQRNCEELIIGILQHNKTKMLDVLDVDVICSRVVNDYNEWNQIFTFIVENIFRSEDFITKFESVVTEFVKNIENPTYMRCCFLIIKSANKVKKGKMSKNIKSLAEKYKTTVCDKILELVSKNSPDSNLIIGYTYCLKNFLSQDEEKFAKLLKYLDSYVEFAATDFKNCENYLTLFLTVLQNRSKIQSLDDKFLDKIWNICKEIKINSKFEEYSQLLVLIFGHIPNESFSTVTTDLLNITDNSFTIKDYELLGKHLKTWESVVCCNLNPVKTKILTGAIEMLLQKLTMLLQDTVYDETLYQNIFSFDRCLIQTNHFLLTPAIMDLLLLTPMLLMAKKDHNFRGIFNQAISLLDQMLKYRRPLIMDRLPPYLQQYRMALKSLCQKSNADMNLDDTSIREISDCAHQFEKLTKNLVSCQKDMGRISMYLIADILEQYERISLNLTVKIHLNNCIYSFISICDQHAITYLMRVLSSASTEIFKIMYDNYKRYYRFTGKV